MSVQTPQRLWSSGRSRRLAGAFLAFVLAAVGYLIARRVVERSQPGRWSEEMELLECDLGELPPETKP